MCFKRLHRPLAGVSLLFLTACQTPAVPDVEEIKHQLDVPASWQTTSSGSSQMMASLPAEWWKIFHDQQLNSLVEAVIKNNKNLAAAAFRLREAEFNQQLAGTNMAPDVSAGLNGRSSRQLNHGTPSMRSYGSNISLNYEVDLWGKLSATRDASAWEASATAFDLASVRLKLIGSALELYWRQIWYTERLRLLDDEHKRLDYLLKLARLRYQVGSGTQLEVLQAQQEMDNHENGREGLLSQQQENLRSLSVLLAQPPGRAFPFHFRDALADEIEQIEAPLPVALLARRPDLQAAEYRLRSRLANIDITRKSFYPALSLSSSLDAGGNRDLMKLLRDPVGSLGGGIILPFLQFREMSLRTGISEMQYRQAAAEFSQTFYTVLEEVENALAQRTFYYQESLRLRRAATTATQAWMASEAAWKAGLISLKEVLNQQQTLLNIQQQQAENRLNRHVSEMRFFLVTGG